MGGCCTKSNDENGKNHELYPKGARSCTDIPFLILFIIFWFGMIAIGAFSAVQGDPLRLIYGSDSYGNTCGKRNPTFYGLNMTGNDLRNKSYLLSMDITSPFESSWICVEKCPDFTLYTPENLQSYAKQHGVHYCSYEIDVEHYTNVIPSGPLGPCPVLPLYQSTPIMHRCIPTAGIALSQNVMKTIFGFLNDIDLFEQVLADLAASYKEIIMMCIIAFIIALLVVFILRYVAGIIIYVIFGMTIVGSLAVTAVLWYAYVSLKWDLDIHEAFTNGTQLLILETKNEHTLLIYAIAASVITCLFMFLIWCCWSSTKLVVDLFREAGKCLTATPCLLMQPLYTFFALIVLFFYWSIVVLLLATAAQMNSRMVKARPPTFMELKFVDFNTSSTVRYMWWYHLVGLIWTAEFILACQQFVIASSVAIWYFSKKRSELSCTICQSIKRLLVYHMGSVILGSFIITLVKIPRLILLYLQQKLKDIKAPWAAKLLKCCICCLWCIERCLKYLHHNAYTIVAIEGRSFCPSAKQAFQIVANNAVRVSAINTVGDFILFLGKCGVTSFTALIALLVFRSNENLHFYSIPLLLVSIFAFFIAHSFFSVYEMAIDTLFLCYCADNDLADRTGETELYAHPTFIEFMGKARRNENKGNSTEESQPMQPVTDPDLEML